MAKAEDDKIIQIYIPPEIQDITLPDPYMLDYYMGLSRRELWVDDEINEKTFDIVRKIYQWNSEDRQQEGDKRPITLYFNSDGGFLDISIAVAQAVKDSITPIIGINVGACCSGAALIYSQCDIRKSTPSSYFLIHKGSGGTSGQYQQTRRHQDHYDRQVEQMIGMMYNSLRPKELTLEEFDELADNEWYLYLGRKTEDCKHDARWVNLVNETEC